MIQRILLSLVLLGAVYSFVGCSTTEGVGKDVERAGEAIQDAAE
jgi:predicted small secreted protein